MDKKIILIALVVVLAISILTILFVMESDSDRLVRAYEYHDAFLCNLVLNHDIGTRCNAVLTENYALCDKIVGDYDATVCYYDVYMQKRGQDEASVMENLLKKRCYQSIPSRMKDMAPEVRNRNLTEAGYERGCDFESSFILNISYRYMALYTNNLTMCDLSGEYRDECIWILTGNKSALCSKLEDYDQCVRLFATRDVNDCKTGDEECYRGAAILTGNPDLCRKITDKDIRNSCYLHILDIPSELAHT